MDEDLSEEQLTNLLKALPLRLLLRLGRGKLEGVRLNSRQEIIASLISRSTPDDVNLFVRTYEYLNDELEPVNLVWCALEKPQTVGAINSIVNKNPFKLDDKDQHVEENGFDTKETHVSDGALLTTYWYLSTNTDLDANFNLQVVKRDVHVGLRFGTHDKLTQLMGSSSAACSVLSAMKDLGIMHASPTILSANSKVLEDKFSHIIREMANRCGAHNTGGLGRSIEINTMKFYYPTGKIKEKSFRGREDIFNHPDVREEIDVHGGKILNIGGRLIYKDVRFAFRVGFVLLISGQYVAEVYINELGSGIGDPSIKSDVIDILSKIFLDTLGKYLR